MRPGRRLVARTRLAERRQADPARLARQQRQVALGLQRLQVFLRGAGLAEAEGAGDFGPRRWQAVGGDAFADEVEDGLLAVGEIGHGAYFSTSPVAGIRTQAGQWLARY